MKQKLNQKPSQRFSLTPQLRRQIELLSNSNEENRIVEFPYENLEKDIYKIINNMGYKNVYYSE